MNKQDFDKAIETLEAIIKTHEEVGDVKIALGMRVAEQIFKDCAGVADE